MPDIRKMLTVYFIAGTQDCQHLGLPPEPALLSLLQTALKCGISCFQFREKGQNALQDPQKIIQLAQKCRDLCRQYHVPFFINDNVDLALAVQANGVHVGQDDRPIAQVIEQCQGKLLLGLSVNTLPQAIMNAELQAVDYFGVGPIFPTQSKADAKAVVGLKLLQQIRQQGIEKPLVAIGGITPETAFSIRQAGADGVAVISAISRSPNIANSIRQLKGQ
ncbi:thiamine phosphate synthase [Testudinibacter sp. TR-2022]|uniref:thiamine phosphate synthase n=1 Tax=Testudinibacter sp. TR-2022 TaxID=2585029 RepID=UPI001119BA54|nr:thiamine phosphate synthase [Testudinibacter sp. TR-2022]TNH02343.1 thiamine phosphate synthase [Pasteurellaceae bacterium Phil31]TNH08909.1 thiamine phosphate synthase [Testudinibacter sp. TR-2022]TNH11511.1 thiamine phosphate synthase [Testudinibacter sp. TR-2022]TNH14893.1 thiamine phosphate synthase [Testudinibacter sp. TR-2022]TNH19195.1 thiamine phosphate synthase [Testudinibacter sp. TR-2022]